MAYARRARGSSRCGAEDAGGKAWLEGVPHAIDLDRVDLTNLPMNRSVRVCGRGAGESVSHRRHSAGTNCVQSSAAELAGRRLRTDSGTQLFQPPISDSGT